MNDLDFAELAQQWQRDTAALEVSRRKARRQHLANRLLLAGELLLSGVSFWAAWMFWQQDAMVYTVSTLVILVAIAISLWVGLRERIPLWHWHDWSPEGVLRYRVRLCEATLRFAALCRASSIAMLLFTAYLWINAYLDPGSLPAFFPPFYTAVAMLTVASLEWWARRQRNMRTGELAELRALLASFDSSQ